MTTALVVKTSITVNNNSSIQDYVHPDDQTQPTFEMTPGFKPFTIEQDSCEQMSCRLIKDAMVIILMNNSQQVYFGTQHAFVYLLAYSLGTLCANGMSSLYSKPLLDELGTFFENLLSTETRAQLFEGRLALNPGLNLTRVSFSCVQKYFLG